MAMQWNELSLDCVTTMSLIECCGFAEIHAETTSPSSARCATIVALKTFTLSNRVGGVDCVAVAGTEGLFQQ